jgi:murein DD-endopeptidase MepM/ murein hydrolase activator NlpD
MIKRILVLTAGFLPCLVSLARADEMPPVVAVSSPAVAASEPFVWPVSKSIGGQKVKIVSHFGPRKGPPPDNKPEPHTGCDFNVPPGSTVKAAKSGKIIFAGFSSEYVSRADKTEKSRLVIVKHADNTSTRYVHLNVLKVTPGMQVTAGQVLGLSSESDEDTLPVVHFEIRDAVGRPLNPEKFFETAKVP